MKVCSKCKEEKPLDKFPPHDQTRDRRATSCRACRSTYNKKRYLQDPEHHERVLAQGRKWRASNPDYPSEWAAENKERVINAHREWRANNREKDVKAHAKSNQIRRARKQGVEFDRTVSLDSAYERFHGMCGICLKPCLRQDASLDHVHPLSKGGAHTWDNIQLAHRTCNSRKGVKIAS